MYFPRHCQGEFVQQSRASLVADHLLYSHDHHEQFSGDIVRRNEILITLRGQRVHSLFCLYIYYNCSSDKLVNNIHMSMILYLLITSLFDIVVISVLEKLLIDHS